jgi:hypothetical protein
MAQAIHARQLAFNMKTKKEKKRTIMLTEAETKGLALSVDTGGGGFLIGEKRPSKINQNQFMQVSSVAAAACYEQGMAYLKTGNKALAKADKKRNKEQRKIKKRGSVC